MSTRFQWSEIKPFSPTEFSKLSKVFLREKYTEQRGFGVLLRERRDDYIVGDFIEKSISKERIIDPFGKETLFEIPRYRSLSFRVSIAYPQLTLINLHRSVGVFVTFLGDALDNRITITPIVFDLPQVINLLRKNAEVTSVEKLHARNITLTRTISAEAIVQGAEDVTKAAANLIGKKAFLFSSARIQFSLDGNLFSTEIMATGRVRLLKGDDDRFAQAIGGLLTDKQENSPPRR